MYLSEPKWLDCMLPYIWSFNASSAKQVCKLSDHASLHSASVGNFLSQKTQLTQSLAFLASKTRSFKKNPKSQQSPQTFLLTPIKFFYFWHSQLISVVQGSEESVADAILCMYTCMYDQMTQFLKDTDLLYSMTVKANFWSTGRALGIYLTCTGFHWLPHLLN